jgi:hypothetical protein
MKQIMTVLAVITISLLLMTSCILKNSDKNAKNDNDSISIISRDSNTIKNDTAEAKIVNKKAILKVRLFFTGGENEEQYEIKDFNTQKTYTHCYDSETFSKLQIEGNADHIKFIVKPLDPVEDKDFVHLKEENIEIKGKKTYTNKDFDFNTNEIKIQIFQNNEIIFEGSVKSVGCM